VIAAGAEAIGAGSIIAAIGQSTIAQIAEYAYIIKNTYDTFETTVKQFDKMVDAEKRAIKNIASIVDIRSLDDFMNWTNRTMYLAREEEYYFNQMGVQIGKNKYDMTQIFDIPNALINSFRDPFEGDYTEEERREMWEKLGLTPGNYNYMKTWEERNDKIAKRILTYSDIYADEHEEAAARNQNIMDKYSVSSEDLDINEIEKEAHITAMNTEMAIREQTRLMIEMHEYELSKDRMAATPPSPPKRSFFWDENPFGSITSGHATNSYENW